MAWRIWDPGGSSWRTWDPGGINLQPQQHILQIGFKYLCPFDERLLQQREKLVGVSVTMLGQEEAGEIKRAYVTQSLVTQLSNTERSDTELSDTESMLTSDTNSYIEQCACPHETGNDATELPTMNIHASPYETCYDDNELLITGDDLPIKPLVVDTGAQGNVHIQHSIAGESGYMRISGAAA